MFTEHPARARDRAGRWEYSGRRTGPAGFLMPVTASFLHVDQYGHRKPGTRLPDGVLREEKGDVPFVT